MEQGDRRGSLTGVRLRRAALVVLGLLVAMGLWELYKEIGPADGASLFGVRILPRSDDDSMPHLGTVLREFGAREVSLADQGGQTVLGAVVGGALITLKLAASGFLVGGTVGMLLAVLMHRFVLVERALLPYIVLSQTVPLIALAPLVVGWGGNLSIFGFKWQAWMSVAVIAAYLAFFPVAVGALRGLRSPEPVHSDLLRVLSATSWQTLIRLGLPASIGYLVPAFKLAAAASVVGAIVAEISTGYRGGIGRLIISYAQQATGEPAKVYTAILAAALLGLLATSLVSVAELGLRRFQPRAAGR